MTARPARAPRAPIDIRKLDVLCTALTTPGDRWMWTLLWRDCASHEPFEGIKECECCRTRTPHRGL